MLEKEIRDERKIYMLIRPRAVMLGFVFWSLCAPAGASDPQLLEKGKSALEAGLSEEAISLFTQLIGIDPSAANYDQRGLAYSAAGKDALAVRDFEKAASLEPQQPLYHLRKGAALTRMGSYQEAVKSLSQALELEPENFQSFAYRARALFHLGQATAAMDDLTKAIRRNPGNAVLYKLRGDILSSAGEFDDRDTRL